MRAEVIVVDKKNPDPEIIEKAGQILKKGGLVAFPTETVYGLGGNALDPTASMKIYAAKGRPSDNPLIVHIAELDKLKTIVSDIPENTEVINEDCFVFRRGDVDRLRHQIKKIINLNLCTHCNMVIPYTWQDVVQQTLEIYTR